MKTLDNIRRVLLGNPADAAMTMNSSKVWLTFPRAMRYMTFAGMLLGFSYLWLAINKLWLHWPAASFLLLGASAWFACMCFVMMVASSRSLIQRIMWFGMAWIVIGWMFISLQWPGGMAMLMYGLPQLIVLCAAIVYLIHMPAEYRYMRWSLACWVISLLLVSCAAWYALVYYQDYCIDQFEPAIPYADDAVPYLQYRIWKAKTIFSSLGSTMLLFSIIMYIKSRRNG